MTSFDISVACIDRNQGQASATAKKVVDHVQQYVDYPLSHYGFKATEFNLSQFIDGGKRELCLLVTDRVGIEPSTAAARLLREKRFRTLILGHSLGASDEQVLAWRDSNLVDDFVSKKSTIDHLTNTARRLVAKYFSNDPLNSMRDRLLTNEHVDIEYLQEGNTWYSPRQLMLEVLRQTELGEDFLRRWRSTVGVE